VSTAIESYYRLIGALQGRDGDRSSAVSGFGDVVVNDGGSATIAQSEPFTVSTTLRVPEGVSAFQVKCVLEDMHGRHIFHMSKSSSELRVSTAEPAAYRISVACPPLWLTAGLYTLYFYAIFDGQYGSARCASDSVPFDVNGVAGKNGQMLIPTAQWALSHL
jgi:hypothetical protein